MKFNIGDKVRISKDMCLWYLGEEAKECYTISFTGEVDENYLEDIAAIKEHLVNNKNFGIIDKLNHPGTDCENYRILLGNRSFLIDTENINKFRYIRNRPEDI